ncbi:hypothetical protein B7P43_G10163 [Cryptotermes secundus]|uniref:Uncharacterized protein n=1 Tax=Cryptotermes secundus TaxID=105785 RepID=A0A2J7Q8J0_9NEOP|nr:hypothetical protein B7P43_G10163 [Cryptotermes secundus]
MGTIKAQQRENLREGSEHENKQEMPERKTKIRMGTTGYGRYAEGRTWGETEEEEHWKGWDTIEGKILVLDKTQERGSIKERRREDIKGHTYTKNGLTLWSKFYLRRNLSLNQS